MPKIPRDESEPREFGVLPDTVKYQCVECGAMHHYLPADKKGCRRCGGPLAKFKQLKPKS